MSVLTLKKPVIYPESDGQPMSDNTRQFRWIMTIQGGIDGIFRHDENVFVAGNLLWYPVEGDNKIRAAPDVLVAFGRPKGDRGSYLQWLEDHIAPQVVFEVASPGNRAGQLTTKFVFYERYGAEEYYLYDPDTGELFGWTRSGERLVEIPNMNGWVSPRLGVRFEIHDGPLRLFGPDGKPFLTYTELVEQGEREAREKDQALRRAEAAQQQTEHARQQAVEAQQAQLQAQQQAEQAQQQAEQAQQQAEQARQQAEQARQQAEQARREAERLAAKLRELGIDPAR
ncbi:MAG: Uma2 family endonuclease [Planctomycetes bacterium]|nr:Uma2 family endonuclease [Planctomycetota bacterium]